MDNTVYVKHFPAPPINKPEILHYACCGGEAKEISELADELYNEMYDKLSYKVCFRRFIINRIDDKLDLGFAAVCSKSLAENLRDCNEIILFAATVGLEPDRVIKKYSRLSPVKALVAQALGSERVESLCNSFCNELSSEYDCRPRFSPGYGDLSLNLQKEIIKTLDCPRKIGVVLNENLLMSPSKSVTAIVGIKNSKQGE